MQFLVLGPLEVITDGRTVALPAAKHRALLTALLVRVNQRVPADSLIDSLWEGRPPASAAKTLQTYVSQLRREIEPASAASDWRTLLDQIGQAKGSSGELAEARRIAAGLGPDTGLERMLLYWSGEWERSEAAWTAAGDRDARSGDRLDGILNAYWLGRVRRLATYETAEAALAEGLALALQGPQVPAEVMLRAELARETGTGLYRRIGAGRRWAAWVAGRV